MAIFLLRTWPLKRARSFAPPEKKQTRYDDANEEQQPPDDNRVPRDTRSWRLVNHHAPFMSLESKHDVAQPRFQHGRVMTRCTGRDGDVEIFATEVNLRDGQDEELRFEN